MNASTEKQFEVGDRVRIGVSTHDAPPRLTGAIGHVEDSHVAVVVRVDGEVWWYAPAELEHA